MSVPKTFGMSVFLLSLGGEAEVRKGNECVYNLEPRKKITNAIQRKWVHKTGVKRNGN